MEILRCICNNNVLNICFIVTHKDKQLIVLVFLKLFVCLYSRNRVAVFFAF